MVYLTGLTLIVLNAIKQRGSEKGPFLFSRKISTAYNGKQMYFEEVLQMFKGLQKRGCIVEALNNKGIYTQKQIEEMDERIKELWTILNEAYATIDTYVLPIESMLDENYSFCGKKWTEEMKKANIRHICERLKEVKDKCRETLFRN